MRKEKLYKKIAIAFVLLLVISFFLFIFNANQEYIFDQMANITQGSITKYSLEEVQTYSCIVEKPSERTIVLRIDDITPWNDLNLMRQMTDEIINRGYGVALGVIPNGIEKNRDIVRWVQKINENPNIELSLHGYKHEPNEFGTLNYQNARTKIELGTEIMAKYFGEVPINFIPPYNVESEGTIKALKDLNFKTFSGNHQEYYLSGDFAKAGYTATTYEYSQDKFVFADEALKKCETSINKNGVCVMMFHPQDFTTKGKIDEDKYAEYIKVLDGLKNLNADVMNFRQAFCKEY